MGGFALAAAPTPGVPVWFTITVGIAAPLLVLLGALLGHWAARMGTRELDVRARREELLRMVRWSGEQVTKGVNEARVAIAVLDAVGQSTLLQDGDQEFIDAILDTQIAGAVEEYHRFENVVSEEITDA